MGYRSASTDTNRNGWASMPRHGSQFFAHEIPLGMYS